MNNLKSKFIENKKDYLILLSIYAKIFGVTLLYILNK